MRLRRLLFALSSLALVVLLVEAFSLGAYYLHTGRAFSYAEIEEAKRRQTFTSPLPSGLGRPQQLRRWSERVPHPYLGYVFRKMHGIIDEVCQINDHGFLGKPNFSSDGGGAVQVLVTGGSVAGMFMCEAHRELLAELAEVPRFKGRAFNLVGLCLTGYKQPQQLYGLSYYLLLGGKVDLVINIDGLNELTEAHYLHERNTHPSFPMSWDFLVSSLDLQRQFYPLHQAQVLADRRAWAASVHDALRLSPTAGLIWTIYDDRLERDIREARKRAVASLGGVDPDSFNQPHPNLQTPDILAYAADLWAEAQRQMSSLGEARGIPVFSFLQPNQYLPGSKPLSDEERRRFVAVASPLVQVVPRGYPLLRQRGAALARSGVRFTDLSPLFKDVKETLYVDDCCHFNQQGNALMARAIGQAIRNSLHEKPQGPPSQRPTSP